MMIARFRVSLFLLITSFSVGIQSGCGSGWGDAKPFVSGSGHSVTVIQGQAATFTVTPAGTGPFTYQWLLNEAPISGATSSSYTISSTTSSESGESFTVMVTNAGGSFMAGPFTLTVLVPPAITQQPSNQTVTAGQDASFSVSVVSTATTPLNYQWAQDGTAITGATAASFTTPVTSIGDSGSTYTVTISNVAGSVTSSAAILTVNPIIPNLTFAAIPAEMYGNTPFTVSASSTSTAVIVYSVVSGPATISGATVTITGVGPVVPVLWWALTPTRTATCPQIQAARTRRHPVIQTMPATRRRYLTWRLVPEHSFSGRIPGTSSTATSTHSTARTIRSTHTQTQLTVMQSVS